MVHDAEVPNETSSIESSTNVFNTGSSEAISNSANACNSNENQSAVGITKPHQTIVPEVSAVCQTKSVSECFSKNGQKDIYKLFDPNDIEFDDSEAVLFKDFEQEGSDDDYGNEIYFNCFLDYSTDTEDSSQQLISNVERNREFWQSEHGRYLSLVKSKIQKEIDMTKDSNNSFYSNYHIEFYGRLTPLLLAN